MSSDRATQILDLAEREMRKGGLDAVSFRDIASSIGIKSASVHYHFQTKADLSKAVTRRYVERFIDGLGPPDDPKDTIADRLDCLGNAYLNAYETESSTCLCTVLGSVTAYLPEETSNEVRLFFERLEEWIAAALKDSSSILTPNIVLSTLQGAMVLTTARANKRPLEDARLFLVNAVSG